MAGSDLYSDEVFARLPKLRVISRTGVGFDLIDVESATRHKVAVTITPNANHQAVAEHTIALLFAVTRSIVQNDRDVRSGTWPKPRSVPLRGKTLGLVGLGRIGRSVAVRALGLQLNVIACDPLSTDEACRELGIRRVGLDQLLSEADFVSLHTPLTDATRGIINRETLGRMRPGGFLINTARGRLVVEEDLVEALRSGQLAGAGLDVFCSEPPRPDHPLFSLPNVVLTSHIAGGDMQSIHEMAIGAAQNIIDLYEGRWPSESLVNPDVRDGWSWRK
jgi:phosphoglycerate dehydrogenase-like enzyme